MPNRIIKESICTSEKISSLSDFEFRLWAGLIVSADDAGRGDARPAIIKGRVFPLRERVSAKDIESGLHGLAAKGCVSLYTVGGKPYFWFPTWGNHQRIRDCKPKFPGPEDADEQPLTICGELPQVAAGCGLNPIQSNTIQSENESESESNAREAQNIAFDAFWAVYPRKVGKGEARKAFKKISQSAYPLLVPAVERQKKTRQWQEDKGRFVPNPSTWLNQGRWEDDAEGEKYSNTSKYESW